MFFIGIVDVTTVGSTICQRRLNELGGPEGDHPPFAVHSIPFKEYRPAVINKDWDTMSTLIKKSIEQLQKMKIDFIIIPSNTPHYAYNEFARNSTIPIINLIEITAHACKEAGLKRVAILGTKATMTGGLYKNNLERKNMSLVVPSEKICESIHNFIMDEIVPGKVTEETRQKILKLIQSIDCDGYILGCTELPEVYNSHELGKTAIDTTRLLAEVAFKIAINEDRELMLSCCTHINEVSPFFFKKSNLLCKM